MHPNQERKLERLEAAWTVAKSHESTHPDKYQAAKKELALYRRKLRNNRTPADTEGDATATPSTLKAKATDPKKGT